MVAITEAQRAARSANWGRARAAYMTRRQAAADARLSAGAKRCTVCRRMVPLTGYDRDARAMDGRQPYCAECRRAQARARHAAAAAVAAARSARVVSVCCGGALVWDDGLDWWRVVHLAGCRRPWQPGPPGRAVSLPAGWCEVCGRQLSREQRRYCGRDCQYAAQRRVRMDAATPAAAG